ncbi:hypothetical protein NP590_01405 [Methylomonas sp. SURF-2]|uniref:DUF2383 domain-containing protein n=1 Tax=Methylomonas subterranea TaxID=2952225 RepID=A0ABT1TBA2_9GAMM|nr:hypothetical protein [Methylomonas sp. SURF-2]MCQ8102745.1 hypothetical protein [Methylomonas sp. SURF-2]
MKSVKKRFRTTLARLEDIAAELRLLAEDVAILAPVGELAESVLGACEILQREARQLHKADFVEWMLDNEVLYRLDELADGDVISLLEERFAQALGEAADGQVAEMLRQLLGKLDKKLVLLHENIQQLGGLLNEAQ